MWFCIEMYMSVALFAIVFALWLADESAYLVNRLSLIQFRELPWLIFTFIIITYIWPYQQLASFFNNIIKKLRIYNHYNFKLLDKYGLFGLVVKIFCFHPGCPASIPSMNMILHRDVYVCCLIRHSFCALAWRRKHLSS